MTSKEARNVVTEEDIFVALLQGGLVSADIVAKVQISN
jgi:hypothetical protein